MVPNSNHLLEYDVIGLDYKVNLKYLLSDDALFKIEWKNFKWYDYKDTLFVDFGSDTYVSKTYHTSNSNDTLFIYSKDIYDLMIKLKENRFRFRFCP